MNNSATWFRHSCWFAICCCRRRHRCNVCHVTWTGLKRPTETPCHSCAITSKIPLQRWSMGWLWGGYSQPRNMIICFGHSSAQPRYESQMYVSRMRLSLFTQNIRATLRAGNCQFKIQIKRCIPVRTFTVFGLTTAGQCMIRIKHIVGLQFPT
jgi:hypothetical protein